MSKQTTKYYRTVAENQNIKAIYDSETEEITLEIDRKLNMGASIGKDSIRIHKSYVAPIKQLLDEVIVL